MKILKKISDIIYKVTGVWITFSLMTIVVLAFIQVVSRYVFKFSIQWSQELIIYMMMWLVFLGCSMGLRDHEVASLTALTNKLKPKSKLIVALIVNIILLAFFIITIYANAELIRLASRRKSSIMRINMAFMSSAYSVGAVIMAFNCFIEIIEQFIGLFKKTEVEE